MSLSPPDPLAPAPERRLPGWMIVAVAAVLVATIATVILCGVS